MRWNFLLILSIGIFVFCGVFGCVLVTNKWDPHTFGWTVFYDLTEVRKHYIKAAFSTLANRRAREQHHLSIQGLWSSEGYCWETLWRMLQSNWISKRQSNYKLNLSGLCVYIFSYWCRAYPARNLLTNPQFLWD